MDKKIIIVTTMWSSINNWVVPFFEAYKNNGYDLTVAANMSDEFVRELNDKYPYVKTIPIDFPRGINFIKTFKSIIRLTKILKYENYSLIQYSTPNASLCASIASKKAKVPVRIYCQWGMVYVTMRGLKRLVFKMIEKIICRKSSIIQPDSHSNRLFCIKNKIYSSFKSEVIWNGSAKGVDTELFNPGKKNEYRKEIFDRHNIPKDARVIGFVGRLGKEKGCNELLMAFKRISLKYKNVYLLFVGPIEKQKTINKDLLTYLFTDDRIVVTNRVPDVEKYISAMDIFVLPSYREGFGMSVLEASSMEVPVIATKYPGPADAFIDGKTGIAIDIKSVDQIYLAIDKLLSNKELCAQLGLSGRQFVKDNFDQKKFINMLIKNRNELLGYGK